MTLEINIDENSFLKRNYIFLKLYYTARIKAALILFVISMGLLIFGIITRNTFKKEFAGHTTIYNLNISVSIAIALLLYCSTSLVNILRQRKNFASSLALFLNLNNGKPILLFITELGIRYVDFEMIQEFKWNRFSHYKRFKDFIFFLVDGRINPTFIVYEKDLSKDDFLKINDFIKAKLPELE